MSATLYALSNELAAILADQDEDLSEDAEAALNALEQAFESKVEAVLQYRQGLVADADALKAEQQRLKARADAMTKRADWLKRYVLDSMQKLNIGRVSTPTFNASVAKSPLSVQIEDGAEIPETYQRIKTTIEPDKAALLAAFKDGQPLPPGVSVKQNYNLRIS